jgi:hypothetical protein
MFESAEAKIQIWHKSFVTLLDNVAEEGYHLFAFARHLSVNAGLSYPNVDEIDLDFIENLDTPHGDMHYNNIFDFTLENAGEYWGYICSYVYDNNDSAIDKIVVDCNLDTGRSETNEFVFWR